MPMSEGVRPLRVQLLTQYFPPEPYPQTLWLAEALRSEGFAVRVSTSVPNYPTGRVLPGYKSHRLKRESIGGFPVTRVPVYPSHDRRAVGRILNYGSFGVSTLARNGKALRTADVVVVWATPATVGLPAVAERHLSGTPYILYVQDLWPDSIFASGFLGSAVVRRSAETGLQPLLSSLYRNASHVAAITPGMQRELIARGVPGERCSHIYNWVDEDVLSPREPSGYLKRSLGLSSNSYVVAFAGNLGAAQGLDPWIDAMAGLAANSDIHLVLIGEGSEKSRLQSRAADLANVHFHPAVPSNDVADLLADADCLAISLADQELFRITMPSKVQACLAQAKPVVAAVAGDTRHVIREAKAGWLAEPEDPATIRQAVLDSHFAGEAERKRRGLSGRLFYEKHMSKSVGAKALARLVTASAEREVRQ